MRIDKVLPVVYPKGWGSEVWIHNGENGPYCGKLLHFNKGSKFADHFHQIKYESFFLLKGSVKLTYIDTDNADEITINLSEGDVVHIPRLVPHQVEALEDSTIIECSTEHFESDSYRIKKGDSQLLCKQ